MGFASERFAILAAEGSEFLALPSKCDLAWPLTVGEAVVFEADPDEVAEPGKRRIAHAIRAPRRRPAPRPWLEVKR